MPNTDPPSSPIKHGPAALLSISSTISHLTVYDYIRLVWIVGGYIFLRPYLELGFRKLFATQYGEGSGPVAAVGALSDEQGSQTIGPTGWGATARKRHAMIMEAWEDEQAKRAEEEDLEGIDPELLED